jgi:oligopeptidase B
MLKPVLTLSLSLAIEGFTQTPPIAKRVDHTEVRHGATITDQYFWLRDKSSPDVIKYLEAENAYTAELTKN